MLIETPYKVGDTVSIKLSSGEEMVARLENEGPEKITVHKPLMLTATPEGMGLAPYMFTVAQDSKFNLNISNVICIAKTEKNMANKYVESTTGLALN
jgi:hypothetical protein